MQALILSQKLFLAFTFFLKYNSYFQTQLPELDTPLSKSVREVISSILSERQRSLKVRKTFHINIIPDEMMIIPGWFESLLVLMCFSFVIFIVLSSKTSRKSLEYCEIKVAFKCLPSSIHFAVTCGCHKNQNLKMCTLQCQLIPSQQKFACS